MNNRQNKILQKLKKEGHVSIAKEAALFEVNEMTIRRDLIALEKIGEATRIHGGAVPWSPFPDGLDIMTAAPRQNQILIAKETVKQLEPNISVMLNTGTTVLQVAREIAAKEIPLTVITNSLPVAIALYRTPCQVVLPGGSLRQKWADLSGPLTRKNLDEYYVDVLITGCDAAMSEDGFFTDDINLAEIEQKSVEISKKVIVVTESSKFGHRSFAKFAELDEIDSLITDNDMKKTDKENIRKRDINLILPEK